MVNSGYGHPERAEPRVLGPKCNLEETSTFR